MQHRPCSSKRSAFSLVELSIVLVILGLLVGGILAGQSLIRAAELRSVTVEQGKYVTAISAFRDKYFAIPGDFSNSSGFGWGSWNGNSNGNIDLTTSVSSAVTPGTMNEASGFWLHLSSAGLVEGSYTPIAATSATVGTMTANTNNPRSKIITAGWNVVNLGSPGVSDMVLFPTNYGNSFLFGGGTAIGTAAATAAVLKPEEAWNIDTKLDDGRPDQGTVLTYEAHGHATTGCSVGAPSASAISGVTYDLDNPAIACSFIFKSGY